MVVVLEKQLAAEQLVKEEEEKEKLNEVKKRVEKKKVREVKKTKKEKEDAQKRKVRWNQEDLLKKSMDIFNQRVYENKMNLNQVVVETTKPLFCSQNNVLKSQNFKKDQLKKQQAERVRVEVALEKIEKENQKVQENIKRLRLRKQKSLDKLFQK